MQKKRPFAFHGCSSVDGAFFETIMFVISNNTGLMFNLIISFKINVLVTGLKRLIVRKSIKHRGYNSILFLKTLFVKKIYASPILISKRNKRCTLCRADRNLHSLLHPMQCKTTCNYLSRITFKVILSRTYS